MRQPLRSQNQALAAGRAARGEEIVITKSGKPLAKLVPYRPVRTRREGENLLGITFIAEDFDDPLSEIEAAFEGRE